MLHHEWVGDTHAPNTALVAHGILGSGRNWRSIARRLADALPHWRFLLVDLRCHGKSPSLDPPHTLKACAGDLDTLATIHGGVDLAIGHSFGGKVVCSWLRQGALLDQVWVLDSTPGTRPVDPVAVEALSVIDAVRGLPLPQPSRAHARTSLLERGLSPSLVSWLLTSLIKGEDGWRWVWDLDGVSSMITDYLSQDFIPWMGIDVGAELHWVRAEQSDRWSAEELTALAGLDPGRGTHGHVLSNSGHWLHVDNPDGLLELLQKHWPS